MNKKILLILILIIQGFTIFGQKKDITLEEIWFSSTFSPKRVAGFNSMKDGKHYCKLENTSDGTQFIGRYLFETGALVDTLISGSKILSVNKLNKFDLNNFELSKDESKAIITIETESIYRHSSKSITYVLDISTHIIIKVSNFKIMYPSFNPQATKIAYVLNNNLYLFDLKTSKVNQITKDGKNNEIINGAVDWVYEEEFSMSRGFCWNENGNYLAYYKFNEKQVPEFSMDYFKDLYPTQVKFKYPKAGEINSVVDVYIYNLKSKKSKKINTGSENDQYLPRINWTKNNEVLTIQRLNRLQNKFEILLVNAINNEVTVGLTETNDKYIDIPDEIYFLDDKKHFIISSEKDGYKQLYLHKLEGPQVMQITDGKFDIGEFLAFNETQKKVFYTSFEQNTWDKHIYSIDLDGKNKKNLIETNGVHSAIFNSNATLFLHTFSNTNTPYEYTLRNANGEIIRTLETNENLKIKIREYNIAETNFSTLNINNETLSYWIIKPNNYDSTKKYPLLMFLYGGPGSQQVLNQWGGGNYYWHQLMANKYGYIIACVDNRGTGAKGEAFKKITYKQLGNYESDDQIAAAKYFGNLSFVDKSRIGIWGWSYGGFMSSICIMKGADVFKTAIAVAPVTNWRYYDNIYTERYMALPKDNAEGYDKNSPINMVDKLKGNYLIIHGTADDNVHFQNSAEMVNKMIGMNKEFKSAYYPNKNHGIYGGKTRLHLFNMMTKYILENL